MRNILFLCTGNSARSIMAEAYMNHASGARLDASMTEKDVETELEEASGRRWRAFSAGSKPTGKVNPFAIETLHHNGISLGGWALHPGGKKTAPRKPDKTPSGIEFPFYSKSWDEFASDDAPIMDAIVTVCDNAAGETCPVWPTKDGARPSNLHWSFPDPAAVEGDEAEKRTAFETIFASIRKRINEFLEQDNA